MSNDDALRTGVPRYAVIGHPVAQSKSPAIHQAFASQRGLELRYDRILARRDGFQAALGWFRGELRGRGLSVTLPFKEAAFRSAAAHTARALRAGAANTLILERDGSWRADNTDGCGLVVDLERNLGCLLQGRRVLLLGAGGAARGVLGALLERRLRELLLVNRGLERAKALARNFAAADAATDISRTRLHVCGYEELAGRCFDLIINATSLSLQGRCPPLPPGLLSTGGVCYDLVYADQPTAFLAWGAEQGAALLSDGLGMLVEQAAESFHRWHGGARPESAPVIAALRAGRLAEQPAVLNAPGGGPDRWE